MPLRTNRYAKWTMIFFLGVSLSGCSMLPEEEEALAPPLVKPAAENYQTVKVKKATITNDITLNASFESTHTDVAQFTGTGGRVEEIMVSSGDKVKKGDVLVKLVLTDLDLQVKEQELALERAKLALKQMQKQNKDQQLLPGDPSSAKQSLKIASLQVDVEQLKYDRLVKQFQSKQLKASMDGQVVFVEDIKPGDYVDTFQTLVIVADPAQLQVSARVDSADQLKNVEVGFPAEVKVTVNNEVKKLSGKVVQTPASAPQTLNKELAEKYSKSVYIDLSEQMKGIEIGQIGDVNIVTQQKDNVLIIPKSGLRSFMGRNFVRVLEDGSKLREVDVETGITASTEIEIVKGLSEGEVVVLQ